MRKFIEILRTESLLYMRDFFGSFFTFVFPVLMVLMYGSIYGNEPSAYFNNLGAMDVSIPAYSAMIIGVTGLMVFPLTIASCKENNVYKRYDATPAGKGLIIAAQTVVNFIMTLLGFLLLFAVGKAVYNIQVAGSWFGVSLALLLSVAAIFSLGFFLTAAAPTAKISNLLCYISYFVMIFLSGATMPKELFPDTLKNFSRLLPLTHAVTVLQGTFRGAAFSEYQYSVLSLCCVFVFCLLGGALLYKRQSWR